MFLLVGIMPVVLPVKVAPAQIIQLVKEPAPKESRANHQPAVRAANAVKIVEAVLSLVRLQILLELLVIPGPNLAERNRAVQIRHLQR